MIVFCTTKTEYEIPAEFRYVLCRFMSFSEHASKEMEIAPQHQALLAIKGFPGRGQITVGELFERLQIKRQGHQRAFTERKLALSQEEFTISHAQPPRQT